MLKKNSIVTLMYLFIAGEERPVPLAGVRRSHTGQFSLLSRVGAEDQTQVVKLGGKRLSLQSLQNLKLTTNLLPT